MNDDNFIKLLEQQLIQNLLPYSVEVMDNAAYHCLEKILNLNALTVKAKMQEWLTNNNMVNVSIFSYHDKCTNCRIIKMVPALEDWVKF